MSALQTDKELRPSERGNCSSEIPSLSFSCLVHGGEAVEESPQGEDEMN